MNLREINLLLDEHGVTESTVTAIVEAGTILYRNAQGMTQLLPTGEADEYERFITQPYTRWFDIILKFSQYTPETVVSHWHDPANRVLITVETLQEWYDRKLLKEEKRKADRICQMM